MLCDYQYQKTTKATEELCGLEENGGGGDKPHREVEQTFTSVYFPNRQSII